MSLPKVAIVSVSYNDEARLPQLLISLRGLTYKNWDYILVDNHSRDGSIATVRALIPEADIISNKVNYGLPAGYNQGSKVAEKLGAKYIFLMAIHNILTPECLERLVDAIEGAPNIGVVAPASIDPRSPDRVEAFGIEFDVGRGIGKGCYQDTLLANLPASYDVSFLDLGASLVKLDLYLRVGGIDERLFLYGEEIDLGLKLRQMGYIARAISNAVVINRHSEIRGRHIAWPHEVFYSTRNIIYLARKYGRPGDWQRVSAGIMLSAPLRTVHFLRRGLIRQSVALWLGLVYGMCNWMGKRLFVD